MLPCQPERVTVNRVRICFAGSYVFRRFIILAKLQYFVFLTGRGGIENDFHYVKMCFKCAFWTTTGP